MEKTINQNHIWNKTNQWAEELKILHQLILKKNLTHTIKWGGSVYTFQNKNILGISGFKNFFTIWFFKGVFLKDENKMLINAQEGVTKSMRQWRFFSKKDIDEAMISTYIDDAIVIENEGKNIPKKSKNLVIPMLFENELCQNPELKIVFEKISDAKKVEFCNFISEAKKPETQLKRIEKIKPLLMNNKGLNDMYK